MSTLQTINVKHPSSTSNNVILGSSGNTTIGGALTVSGNATITGTLQANGVTGTIYPLTLDTAKASTSGTFVDFTGIPSWVRRITVMFNGISTNGTSAFLLQVGTSSGVVVTGYSSGATYSSFNTVSSAGFVLTWGTNSAAFTHSGIATLATLGSNIWVQSGACSSASNALVSSSGGNVTLAGALDRIRITTVNGTDVFDAGSINILYE